MPEPLLDIRPDHLQIVRDILQKHVPQYEVWAFGSRAKWTAKEYSDLDLCIVSDKPLSFSVLGAIGDDFSESDLPWKVDVVDWATTSPSFRKIIDREKVVVQKNGTCMQLGWSITNLGSITKWLSGGTPKKDISEYWGGDIPWISANSMHSTRFADSELKITHLGLAAGSRIAPKDSILLLVRGGALHNRLPIGIATRDVAFNQDVKALAANKEKINPWYLLYWLMSQERFLLESVVEYTGIGAGKLDTARMQALEVMLPPLSEQEKILELIKSVDDKIALLRESNATLEAIAQALFKSWFVNFDPVRAKTEGREPEGIPPEIAALFPSKFEDSKLGEIPKGWQIGTLAKLATLNPESWTAKKHPATVGYIDLANAKDNEIAAVTEYLFDDAPSRARRVLRNGDTIVGTVRPGNRSYAFIHEPTENLTASTGFAVLRPIAIEDTEFVYLAATQESSIEHLAHVADGGAYPAVRPEVVAGLPCILPSKEIMHVFHETTAPLLADIAINQKQTESLAALRDTLLPRLMSGKLLVPSDTVQEEESA